MITYTVQRLGIIQRVLPSYRRPFFERLAQRFKGTTSLFVGQPMVDEGIKTESHVPGVEVYHSVNRYWRGPGGMLCWQSGLRSWLERFNPQVLVVEANPRILSHWVAIRWMRQRGLPVVGWGLGELSRTGPVILRHLRVLVARRLIRSFDRIIAYSTKAKEDYISAGVPPEHIFVAYNSIDNSEAEKYLSTLGKDKRWIDKWKRDLGLDPALPVVLYVGRLIPPKRVDLLLEAYSGLRDRCQLVIVGDGPLRHDLEHQASSYTRRVLFVGYQGGEALARFFIASDVFVLPGAGGLAIHQAMSYGKPIIVSFGDGTERDLVEDGRNGYFFKANDVEDLRQKVERLLDEPDLRKRMGEQSLYLIRTRFNIDIMVKVFLQTVMVSHREAVIRPPIVR